MFELYQLRYFLAVVETGNFTRAAERSTVTQPTLSAGIRKLEDQLGTRLFHRSSRRVFLTEAGSSLVNRAKTILLECNQVELDLQNVRPAPVLRLGALRTIPALQVSALIRAFRASNDQVAVELFEGTEQELANRLDDGTVDIALALIQPRWSNRRQHPLYEEGYRLALAVDHPLADRARIDGSELANANMIVRSRCEVLSDTSRYFTERNVRPRLAYRTNHDERALAIVASGLGVTVMPDGYSLEGVRRVPLAGFNFRRQVGLILGDPSAASNDSTDHTPEMLCEQLIAASAILT